MKRILLVTCLMSCLWGAEAREALNVPARAEGDARKFIARVAATCNPPASRVNLDINNVRAMILRGNDYWWDQGGSGNARYEIPKLDDPTAPKKNSLFAGSVWVGGIDANGLLKIAAQTYRQATVLGAGWWAGPLSLVDATITNDQCKIWDKHWKLNRRQVQDHINAISTADPNYVIPQVIREWPVSGDLTAGQDPNMAPYVDADGNGSYTPDGGDYPFIYGDQSIWFVTNDKGNTPGSGSTPIGMEIQTQAFAYQSNDELNNMTFYYNKIINRSSIRLDSCFMAQWVDPDLGNYTDDFVGCDVPRGLGICYNGDDDDEGIQGYGINPPSVGIDFFEGPFADPNDGIDNDRDCTVDEFVAGGCDPEPRTERIIMAKFLYFNNDGQPNGNPTTAENAYNYMVGRWRDNTRMVYGGNGYPGSGGSQPTINSGLMFPGGSDRQYGWGVGGSCQNPIATPFDWSENAPGPGANPNVPADRRFVQSAGPFTLQPGAVNYVTIGVVWARASSGGARGSFNLLLKADSKSQALFDNCFKTIDGPDAPDVDITELDQELILTFSYKPTSNNYRLGYRELDPIIKALNDNRPVGQPAYDSVYKFEGFKVYQLSASNVSTGELDDQSKARMVYQGDIQNSVDRIINWEFDTDLEQSVPFLAVNGANKGVNMTLKINRDAFAEGSDQLVNFKKYYYTVIAYGYNNYARYDIVTDTGQQKPYLPGRNNVKTYTGIPHKSEPTFDGLVLNSDYGDQPEVRRIEGVGNGGNIIEIDSLDVLTILENGFMPTPLYKKNAAPINLKVIDPTAVPEADMRLFMYKGTPGSVTTVDDQGRWYVVLGDTGSASLDTIYSDTVLVAGNEQILGYYETTAVFKRIGLSATIRNSKNPGEDPAGGNGVLFSTFSYDNPQNSWLSFLPDDERLEIFDWIRSGTPRSDSTPQNPAGLIPPGDPQRFFENIAEDEWTGQGANPQVRGGTWAPMLYAAPAAWWPGLWNFLPGVAGVGALNPEVRYSYFKIDKLASVDVVITKDKSKWTRACVIETCEDSLLAQNRQVRNRIRVAPSVDKDGNPDWDPRNGLSWFPGYAINLETGERLNISFGEDSRYSSIAGHPHGDMKWNPTDSFFSVSGQNFRVPMGGRHFIYVMNSRYDQADVTWRQLNKQVGVASPVNNPKAMTLPDFRLFYNGVLYTSVPLLRPGKTLLDNDYTAKIRISRRYSKFVTDTAGINKGNPHYLVNLRSIAPRKKVLDVAKSALDLIRVVPNPYYGASNYEVSQIDNRVKITNLPTKCTVRIYTLNGNLIRTLRKDDPTATYLDWDLLNQNKVPIASGSYLIHVDAPGIGEKTVKWFGVLRPVDLDTF